MKKYMFLALNVLMFALVAAAGYWVINKVVQLKIDHLTAADFSNITTVSEFKTALKEKERKLQCMTQNIYWEAASEPAEGKVAVGQIVMNRVASGKFPGDPCQVITQKNIVYEKVLCQFSWYCESNHKTKIVQKEQWDQSREAAKMVLIEGFRIPELKDALYYHADYVNPQWNKVKVAKIGRHIFYKDRI